MKKPAEIQSEAERFKEFARKLVSVPTAEIDKKAGEYHKQRSAEKEDREETKVIIALTTTS